jgi:DNA-binding NtrC family response regulator
LSLPRMALHIASHGRVSSRKIRATQVIEVMPEMSGRELASQVRARYPECRVLLMSGYFDEAAGERGAPDGLPFLQKPFTLASLVEKVREVLDQPA